MANPSQLVVWMNGERVGVWSRPRSRATTFQYDPAWVNSASGRALSLSLPFTPGNIPHRGERVSNYFDNLLPDSVAIRSRIRTKFSIASAETFDLLAVIGRDCVGAVQLMPPDEVPANHQEIDAVPLDDAGVEQVIAGSLSDGKSLGQTDADDFRISIAGAQEKTALLYRRNRWWRPHGATPTTHILKLPLGLVGNIQADMQDSVENEWLCSRIMQAFGLETAHCEMVQFGSRKVLAVERFDRAWQGKRWIARLPQEDFCQALGLPSQMKYEVDGGPGMKDILRVLVSSSRASPDMRAFVKAQMVFWMLAATDGHAKNFSLFHERGGTYRLTPFYDVLSVWPIMGKGAQQLPWQKARLAMAIRSRNVHWKLQDILPRHWDVVARAAGVGDAGALCGEICAQSDQVIRDVSRQLPVGFPSRVSDTIFAGIKQQAKVLEHVP